jgi:hypothetical protein
MTISFQEITIQFSKLDDKLKEIINIKEFFEYLQLFPNNSVAMEKLDGFVQTLKEYPKETNWEFFLFSITSSNDNGFISSKEENPFMPPMKVDNINHFPTIVDNINHYTTSTYYTDSSLSNSSPTVAHPIPKNENMKDSIIATVFDLGQLSMIQTDLELFFLAKASAGIISYQESGKHPTSLRIKFMNVLKMFLDEYLCSRYEEAP